MYNALKLHILLATYIFYTEIQQIHINKKHEQNILRTL
jgi:hypothetical protein